MTTTTTNAARPSTAHNGAEHDGAEHNGAKRSSADHRGAEHKGAEHDGAEHDGGEDAVTQKVAAQHDGATATDPAFARIAIETVAAALRETSTVAGEIVAHTAVAVESAAGKAQGRMSGGVAAAVKKVAGLTLDIYQQVATQQLAIAIVLADRVPVEWISELTRRNADAIGELVAVSAGAAHELLE